MTEYHYLECGLDNVWLLNGVHVHETPYGTATSIDDMEGLHAAIGLSLTRKPGPLTGAEIRFLRIELDMSQKGLARIMKVTDQTVARWEKGETECPGSADTLLRIYYEEKLRGRTEVEEIIDILQQLDELDEQVIQLMNDERGWHKAA